MRIQDKYLGCSGTPLSLKVSKQSPSETKMLLARQHIFHHGNTYSYMPFPLLLRRALHNYLKDKVALGFDWLQTITNMNLN